MKHQANSNIRVSDRYTRPSWPTGATLQDRLGTGSPLRSVLASPYGLFQSRPS
jgi:hypothetical protein